MSRILTRIFKVFFFIAFDITSVLAQGLQFQREIDTIPVIVNGMPVHSPFAGGVNSSKPTFADIDNDGDLDLFVGASGGNINFYRNTGTAMDPIFILETENFASINEGNFSFLSPTFVDIDDDGDLDLFVGRGGLLGEGGIINFYRNTGTAENPIFTLETENFADIDVVRFSSPTFADIDSDGDFDLFVGTLGPTITFYRNTGTASNPVFILETGGSISLVGHTPTKSTPTFADIDNDGDLDLFVGEGSDALTTISGGNTNFYRNTGTATNPDFALVTENFADIDVGDDSAPTLADIDNDGDFDLFVGELDGNINFYPNTGTVTSPDFTIVTENFSDIDVGRNNAPTFVDIDDDGDLDLFAGETDGNINFYQNTGTVVSPNFVLVTENFAGINVGGLGQSTPTFADIDNDGDLDLFVGEEDGNVNFYRNTGTATNPNFELVTENLVDIDVEDFGFSTPTFADIDDDGDLDLFVGERLGNINFYRNTGTATSPDFTLVTENFSDINVGAQSAPTFTDIDNDGDLDLFVGELDGNINFYLNIGTATNPSFSFQTNSFASVDVVQLSTPVFADIDDDGILDLFVGGSTGNISFLQRTGTVTDPIFTFGTENFASVDVGEFSTPTFADIDNDGDLDLFVGEMGGTITSNINFYRNTGTVTNPGFTFETTNFVSILGKHSVPSFADIDNDGDLDLVIGEGDFERTGGNINFYQNTGTATIPSFTFVTQNFASIDVGEFSTPTFADIDNDGDFDLFVGEGDPFGAVVGGNINFYRNTGTATDPNFRFAVIESIASIDVGEFSTPTFADIDNDGDLDLFVGESGTRENGGKINFFLNTGTAENPSFLPVTEGFELLNVIFGSCCSAPTFVDIDNDGDLDLFVGVLEGGLHFYRNLTPALPNISLSRISVDFGRVGVNNKKEETVTIDNKGTLDLIVNSIERTSGNNEFKIVSPATFPITITPSDQPTTVKLEFAPTSPGNKSAVITITSDDPHQSTIDVLLSGSAKFLNPPLNLTAQSGKQRNVSLSWEPPEPTPSDTTEIFYDDGTAENGIVGNFSGAELAVRFTPTSYPVSLFSLGFLAQGNRNNDTYGVRVYLDPEASNGGPTGSPVFDGSVRVSTSGTTTANFPSPITIDSGDFYISLYFISGTTADFVIGLDESSDAFRSWLSTGPGTFMLTRDISFPGNLVIRAVVEDISGSGVSTVTSSSMPKEQKIQGIGAPNFKQSNVQVIEMLNKTTNAPLQKIDYSLIKSQPSDFNTIVYSARGNSVSPTITLQSYNIYRSTMSPVELDLENLIGNVEASINSFNDTTTIDSTTYYYVATALYDAGESGPSNEVSILITSVERILENTTPKTFALYQNYPNPSNPKTTIKYDLSIKTEVRLKIYNVLGQLVRTLVNEEQPAGFYSVRWDGKNDLGKELSSGIYLYRLDTKEFVKTKKLLLVR